MLVIDSSILSPKFIEKIILAIDKFPLIFALLNVVLVLFRDLYILLPGYKPYYNNPHLMLLSIIFYLTK